MKTGFCFLFLLACNFLVAQKKVKKSIDNPNITFIQIDVTNGFSADLQTGKSKELIVEVISLGDNQFNLKTITGNIRIMKAQ